MKLRDICKYRGEKIELKKIKKEQYISTDNMLPNFSGIGEIKSFPNVEKVNKCYKNDILISNIRPYFKKMIISDIESGCSSDILVIETISKDVNPKFLYYRLMADDFFDYVILTSKGTKMPRGDKDAIMNFELILPNIRIQNKIVEILETIDKKIKLNNQINNNLYELEKALYKKYFKDLPADNTKKLGELCNIKYGKGLPTKKIEKEGYPVYGGNGIIGYYHEFMYDDSQVLISCRGAASGNVIVSKPKSFVTNNSLILESDRKYHHYLKQYSLDNYYYEYTTGSAQPQITIDNIKDIVLIIPSDELLEAFNKQMDSLELKAFANLEELEKLKKLRDTLLPKLMNGEIDLENIEI